MLTIKDLKRAERFVTEQQEAGANVRWDGWDIVFFRPAEQALKSRHGVLREVDGRMTYGFDNRVSPSKDGVWEVDWRNVKRIKRSRN